MWSYLKSFRDEPSPVLGSVSRSQPLKHVSVPHELDERLPEEAEGLDHQVKQVGRVVHKQAGQHDEHTEPEADFGEPPDAHLDTSHRGNWKFLNGKIFQMMT